MNEDFLGNLGFGIFVGAFSKRAGLGHGAK
jgi:hypothetical protein